MSGGKFTAIPIFNTPLENRGIRKNSKAVVWRSALVDSEKKRRSVWISFLYPISQTRGAATYVR
jgi:hypothetical protein